MTTIVLDNEKKVAVSELRRRIQEFLPEFKNDYRRHDANLVKFLIARDFNVDKAEDMVRKNLEWRKQKEVNNICKRPVCHELDAYYTFHVTGFDRLGRPVVLAPVGQWRPIAAAQAGLRAEGRTMLIQFCEALFDLCEELSSETSMIVNYMLILDLGGFDYRQLTNKDVFSLFREVVSILLNNFPENMYGVRIVNAPRVFAFVWSLVKPLLTARSLSKIQIFGAKKDEWRSHLLDYIDEDNLPSQYGGANTSSFISMKFDMNFGLVEAIPVEVLPEQDFVSQTVEPGKFISVEVRVDAGDFMLWNFKTDDHDIGFQLDYEDTEPIIPFCRVDSHKFLQKGIIRCEFSGKYKITFDNSFSMMTGKTVKYAVQTRPK